MFLSYIGGQQTELHPSVILVLRGFLALPRRARLLTTSSNSLLSASAPFVSFFSFVDHSSDTHRSYQTLNTERYRRLARHPCRRRGRTDPAPGRSRDIWIRELRRLLRAPDPRAPSDRLDRETARYLRSGSTTAPAASWKTPACGKLLPWSPFPVAGTIRLHHRYRLHQ